MAAFFTLNAHSKGGGTKKMSGLVIVQLQPGSAPAGAALFDDAAHFSQSEPHLMKALNDAWRNGATKDATTSAPAAKQASEATVPLQMATGGDRSAASACPKAGILWACAAASLPLKARAAK